MIDAAHFELIRRRHGAYASWAVWAPSSGSPKSNMGDLGVLSEHRNPALLETLNPGVVMVGLNVAARSLASEPFRNFHDPSPVANDFKIRFAFSGTEFWGAYMTDVIKNHPETQSKRLLVHLKAHPEEIPPHIEWLRAELHDLGCARPVILAFGQATYRLLKKYLGLHEYSLLLPLTHYSHRISKENYQKAVLQQIERARPLEMVIGMPD